MVHPFLGSRPTPAGLFEVKSARKQPLSKDDFLVNQRAVYFSDFIRMSEKNINNHCAFRMTAISLDVVGQNIVVYASTGITPPFSRFKQFVESGLTTIFLFFSASCTMHFS